MKINTNSWHFRFNDFFFDTGYKHNNLCNYFWATVIHVVLILVLTGALCAGVIGIFFIMIDDFWGVCIFISFLLCFVAPPIVISLLRKKYPPEKSKTKIETLTGEYYKAFKGKYCPKIEYIDPDYN